MTYTFDFLLLILPFLTMCVFLHRGHYTPENQSFADNSQKLPIVSG